MFWFILLAAVMWGVTNPFLKLYTSDMPANISLWQEIQFLVKRPKYLCTQVINLLGSVVFFAGLRDVSVSVGSITANALAFIITVLVSGVVLKERQFSPKLLFGCLLVIVGCSLCTLSSRSN